MKGNTDAKSIIRRRWGNHRRICNHHARRCWLCWIVGEHFEIRGSKAITSRNGQRSTHPTWSELENEHGAVTAEFALVIPVVVLVLALVLSVMSLQSQRFQLIELAAMSSRSIARGENLETSTLLAKETNPAMNIEIQHQDHLVCVVASKESQIFWLGKISLSETQCARKNGL